MWELLSPFYRQRHRALPVEKELGWKSGLSRATAHTASPSAARPPHTPTDFVLTGSLMVPAL